MPFSATAVALAVVKPITIPVGLILIAHAWIIPELYAARGAGVLRRRPSGGDAAGSRALLLLGDLIGHAARELHAQTGLVLEGGELGTWLLSESGALLVAPGGHRVHCLCVRSTDSSLPHGDQIAHLLLALRQDESGFATVANLAFSGACWRLARRLPGPARAGLEVAVAAARA